MKNFPHLTGIVIGSQVVFGRPNGEKTKGMVTKINPKSIKILPTEHRVGRCGQYSNINKIGTVWKVHPSMVSLIGGKPSLPQPSLPQHSLPQHSFRVGDKVSFLSKRGKVEGHIKRVNKKTISVSPLCLTAQHQYWRVSPSILSLVK